MRHAPAASMGGATDGAAVGASGASSAPVGETVAQPGPGDALAVAGVWISALAAGRLGGARRHPLAARVEGQRALQLPSPARNPASGKLFRALSWAGAGRFFALKTGSCGDQYRPTRSVARWPATCQNPALPFC